MQGILRSQPPGERSRARREYLASRIEVLLARRIDSEVWEALVRPGRKVGNGERLFFEQSDLEAEVVEEGRNGVRQLRFHAGSSTEISEVIRVESPRAVAALYPAIRWSCGPGALSDHICKTAGGRGGSHCRPAFHS